MRAALWLALSMTLSACLSAPGSERNLEDCEADTPEVRDLPGSLQDPDVAEAVETDPRQDWDALLWLGNQTNTDFSLGASPGWHVRVEPLAGGAPGSQLLRLRLTPSEPDSARPVVKAEWTASVPARPDYCLATASATWGAELLEPREGAVAVPGKAVHVWTAGFWENGTLFYTNIPSVDASPWPRAGWYEWEGGEPLPVYVYESDRGERPGYWAPCEAVAPYASCPSQAQDVLWQYYTTIPGFNEALQGLSDATARVAWMPPEKGYTRPGNEAHALYGDALVFYIVVERVVDVPCPEPLYGFEFGNPCDVPAL